jgi:CheY-like chemotaxis protein
MSRRILVIEDTENNRRILSDLLTNAGFEVLEAVDGEKGVAMAAESRPDLILMDIQLPIIDGYEATRRIKANPELRTSLSSPSHPMPYPATMRRRWQRDATAISPNRLARASFSPKCTNSWCDAEGAVACELRREY